MSSDQRPIDVDEPQKLDADTELTDHLGQLEAQAASDLAAALGQLQSSQPGTDKRREALEQAEDAIEMLESVEERWSQMASK